MEFGLSLMFQRNNAQASDEVVWQEELRLADQAEALGFQSIWTVEHHFTDYCVTPDPLQFLTFMAGRTSTAKLGTMAVIVPWHDPVRVVEQASLLDIVSDGRLILGIGRGLGRIEFEGFRVPMDEARGRFDEAAEFIRDALHTGVMRYEGAHYEIPERRVRPESPHSFEGRLYAAVTSPETIARAAELGFNVLVVPQKPYAQVKADLSTHARLFAEQHGVQPPPPACAIFVYCDDDPDRVERIGKENIGKYYDSTMAHYELRGNHFANTKGYEMYAKMSKAINKADESKAQSKTDDARDAYVSLHAIGSPRQVSEKLQWLRSELGCETVMTMFKFGDMDIESAENSMRLFAAQVLPELRTARESV